MGKLTIKQDRFVKAYLLNGGNATQAAIDAGYSPKTAQQVGSENLLKPVIAECIAEHQKKGEAEFIYSKEKKLALLQMAIDKCGKDGEQGLLNASGFLGAIKEHNAMQGDNAPSKHDLLSSDGSLTPTVVERVIIE